MNPDDSNPSAPPPLRGGALLFRFVIIGLVVGGIAVLFLYKGGWFPPHALSQDTIVNEFEHANGEHPGFRRLPVDYAHAWHHMSE